MLQNVKRAFAWSMALILTATTLFMIPAAAQESAAPEVTATQVEHTLDFTKMSRIGEGRNEKKDAENKEKVRNTLLAAGAVACENLYLAGNFEILANPGGYKKVGYYVQKVAAVEGETIQSAILNLGYWICDRNEDDPDAEQGYIEVYASADNENYALVYEQREGNGKAFENSRRTASIELPFVEGQTEIYVKVCMEHWNTYEGAGVAYSILTINMEEKKPVESEKTPEECAMVTASHNFNSLAQGSVRAEDIGAVAADSMYFGIDGVPLLTPDGGYKTASATWMLAAAEGEPLHDCVLTFVGRTWWMTESVKNDNRLRIYASVDGIDFTMVKEFRSNDNEDDTQRFVVDLTEVVKGHGQAYVKMEWLLFDSPHIFGIRSVTLTGNTMGIDNSGDGPRKMAVTNVQSFTSLPVGPVDKETLYAYKSANLMFGYEKTPLLTASEAGEDAYVTWVLNAVEGEPFEDCYLTLIGKFSYTDPALKDSTEMRVHLSVDGETYSEVKAITPTEDTSDCQKIVLDLSAQVYGLSKVYIRVYWTSKDDPAAMGLRSASLVANAGTDYELFTPELENREITDIEMPGYEPPQETQPTQPTQPATVPATGEPQQPQESGAALWIGIGVAAAVVIAVLAVVLSRKKKKC